MKQLENLLLKAARKENFIEELKYVVDFYHNDFNKDSVQLNLELLSAAMETKQSQPCVSEIIDYVKPLSPSQRSIMSEVCTLAKLILVSPATNAVSERS